MLNIQERVFVVERVTKVGLEPKTICRFAPLPYNYYLFSDNSDSAKVRMYFGTCISDSAGVISCAKNSNPDTQSPRTAT